MARKRSPRKDIPPGGPVSSGCSRYGNSIVSEPDRQKWETRYRRRTVEEIGTPDPFLSEVLGEIPSEGAALDLAGGSGRHALLLARHGLEVTLVDVAPAGLALAEAAAATAGLSLTSRVVDLDLDPLPDGPFAVAVCSWYLPPVTRWRELHRILVPEGLLVLIHPTIRNLESHAHPSARFCVVEKDLREQLTGAGFRIGKWQAGWDAAGKHTLRVLAYSQPRGSLAT
jgi:SAM-dependent methyltransferase